MGWRDNLRRASFRGVAFHVEDAPSETGRRNQVHEFYGRDVPFTEEFGRRARRHHFRAYVIGDDYMARRDALIAACEGAASGTLVHPYWGEQQVVADFCGWVETREDGRMCVFDLTFVEAGTGNAPTAVTSALSLIDAGATSAVAAARSALQSAWGR